MVPGMSEKNWLDKDRREVNDYMTSGGGQIGLWVGLGLLALVAIVVLVYSMIAGF